MEGILFQTPFAVSTIPRLPTVTHMSSNSSYFFRLPSELKLEVIEYLDDKRDLYNASKTCRWLEDAVLRRLYGKMDIEIPSQNSPAWRQGSYLNLRPHVVRAVKDITIRDEMPENNASFPRSNTATADSAETYLAQLIGQIPSSQLRSFSLMHRHPISHDVLRLLSGRNWQSLRNFSCYELDCSDILPSALPSNLESIECRTIGDGNALGILVEANKSTLQTLRIGEEKALVQKYLTEKSGQVGYSSQSLNNFKKCVDLSEIQNLRHLCLIGLDLAPITPHELDQALFLANLEGLTIESCVGTPAFLSALTSIFTFVQSEAAPEPKQPPSLKKFLFRQEIFTIALKDALLQFLNSFSGLETLSLLFENGHVNAKPADLITLHGPTLQQLTIESRIQPRHNLRLDTSRPFGSGGYSSQMWEQSMNNVCRLCPNITELSIGFPWNDEMIRLRPSQLPTLTSLKTMHIRNFPESSHLAQMGDYTVREHATKFMEWTFSDVRGPKPQIETLSIGPAIYESRFKGVNPERRTVPEFLRTHHYTLDWAQTRFGRWSPMITGVSERYLEEVRGERPLGGVFEQVWLK